ncbi:MAG: hypothetical protein Q8P41_16130 [Pseudomonadota bacterium]|nr:hypothetical protein [Pseudomonadota bacterium]
MLAVLHLAQAAVYAAAAWELSHRWNVDAALIGGAAVAQLLGVARRPRWEPWLHVASLVLVLVVYGRFTAVALHIERVFGPVAGQQALNLLGGSVLALPWVLAFPLARLWQTRGGAAGRRPGQIALLAPLALLPATQGLVSYGTLPGSERVTDVAGALWGQWSGGSPTALANVALPADARVRVTPLRDGVPGDARTLTGATLGSALSKLAAPGARDALLVDVAVHALPSRLARAGTDAPAASDGRSPAVFARTLSRTELLPQFFAPTARGETLRWRSALASADGVIELARGWAPGPDTLDTATVDTAIRAAVAHLAGGQNAGGRFTYVVRGPSGVPGPGYNYPRHAGTAWFLARAWAATDDPVAAAAADAALTHLDAMSGRTDDGRAYVLDPSRDDGKAWIGTTALGTLALTVRRSDDALLGAYVRQLAASVDDAGKVRGEMTVRDGAFPEQTANAYGQGQTMLALAAAERVGFTDGKAALDRTIRYLESGDYMGTAHPAATGDEHWTCLAARAIRDVRGVSAGAGICAAYVASERWGSPPPGGGLVPATGPAAGGAEAVVAQAWDTQDPALIGTAVAWGRVFLAAQYRAADAPLLGRPASLIGGFRDTVGDLDVQIDAVQHIGCALLGAEALVSGRARPGSLP